MGRPPYNRVQKQIPGKGSARRAHHTELKTKDIRKTNFLKGCPVFLNYALSNRCTVYTRGIERCCTERIQPDIGRPCTQLGAEAYEGGLALKKFSMSI
jgi:hypothetical protein